MKNFSEFIEERLLPLTEKIGSQRHLQAVRDGVIHSLPLILIGSFFLLASFPPGNYLDGLVKPYRSLLMIPFHFTFGLIALYVCLAVAYSLARSYEMEGISSALIASVIFLMIDIPRVVESNTGGFAILGIPTGDLGTTFPIKYMGKNGLFLGIITALAVVEILRFLKKKKLMFRMPPGVPEGVAKSFEAIIPSFLLITVFWVIRDVLKLDLPDLCLKLFKPLVLVGDSLIAVIVLNIVDSIVWFAGVHPVAIIGPFARTIWLQLFTANAEAAAAGMPIPHIAVDQFYYWFVWVGGSGASLGLVLLLLFVPKSKFLKQLGKMCIVPGLFQINEPLIFGLPIVANPLMIVPFALAPMLGGIISYMAFYFNLVNRPYIAAPWTLPPPLGAWVSTGGDWRAALLSLGVILLSAVIYYPFLKIYDKKMLERERSEENGAKE